MADYKYDYDPNQMNEILYETNNMMIAMRKVKWGDKGNYNLDIRKWFINKDGEDTPSRGISFSTDEGPNMLTEALLRHGYGNPGEIIKALKSRDDFSEEAMKLIQQIPENFDDPPFDTEETVYYNPREILKGATRYGKN